MNHENYQLKLPGVGKIGILRANGLGDYVFVLPALAALRRTYPDAEIVYLGLPWHKEFIGKHPGSADRAEIVPGIPGVRTDTEYQPDEVAAFVSKMRLERFDIFLQLHGGGRFSNPLISRFKAKRSVGLRTPDAKPLDLSIPYVYYQNEILRYLDCVRLIGAIPRELMPKITPVASDFSESMTIRDANARKFAVIHSGASDPRRRWHPEGFAHIATYLNGKGFTPVFTGTGEEEAKIVRTIRSRIAVPSINAVNTLSLSGLTGLLSRAAIVVSNDTGPLHLANALGTLTVGLYWCGNYINGAPPVTRTNRAIMSWTIRCPLCNAHCARSFPFEENRDSCSHSVSFLDDIRESEVIRAVEELISGNTLQTIQPPELYRGFTGL